MKTFLIALLLCLAGTSLATKTGHCESTPLHELIRAGKDLYLGESHGTVESPALVKCLVMAALERKNAGLIVSLEHRENARDLQGDVWRGVDGRSSEAMWDLVSFLLVQEKAGRLKLHFHAPEFVIPTDRPFVFDPADYEKRMGLAVNDAAAQGQLIALSGNAHSRKDPLPLPTPYPPAGSFLSASAVHVDLESANGGTAWVCRPDCAVHEVPRNTPFVGPPNTFMDGAPYGHDFVYRLPTFTASPPKYPAK
jgi:hypothetical protein